MGINKENGKFNRHIDLWDALKNNKVRVRWLCKVCCCLTV